MKKIGGNITAQLQEKISTKNEMGESIATWETRHTLTGFLDLNSGDSRYTSFNAKIQESTHYFICDYVEINEVPENSRMVINGKLYDVLSIDNPMNLNYHLEIYLRYVGGQNGSNVY